MNEYSNTEGNGLQDAIVSVANSKKAVNGQD